MLQVTHNEVILNGKSTGYGIAQKDNATLVHKLGSVQGIGMPRSCYSLESDMSVPGIGGRLEFERDFRAVTGL